MGFSFETAASNETHSMMISLQNQTSMSGTYSVLKCCKITLPVTGETDLTFSLGALTSEKKRTKNMLSIVDSTHLNLEESETNKI